ncbi:MAG: helix-turn-helix domain-containing protein [Spirochaetaceae bacterium]|jgi:transcriptional regulator with XRE-family HTH domain|nr:helix-turn-helix domain-containing protein [Spirochaetaceae bacterium]
MKDKKTAKKASLTGDSVMGQRIVLLRHALKLTQVEFSKKIMISNGMIAAIELGKRKVNDRLLRLIKITFGANEHWLRTGEGPMLEQDRTPDYKISEALEAFQKLSPPLQDLVLEHLYKLLEYEQSVKKDL